MQYYNYDQNFLGFDSVSTQGWFVASRRELESTERHFMDKLRHYLPNDLKL